MRAPAHDAPGPARLPATRRTSRTRDRDGTGGAGPAPGRPSGSVLDFGRHIGWSMGEIARVDPGYLAWLSERREGRPYLDEIEAILAQGRLLERLDRCRRPPPATASAGLGRTAR